METVLFYVLLIVFLVVKVEAAKYYTIILILQNNTKNIFHLLLANQPIFRSIHRLKLWSRYVNRIQLFLRDSIYLVFDTYEIFGDQQSSTHLSLCAQTKVYLLLVKIGIMSSCWLKLIFIDVRGRPPTQNNAPIKLFKLLLSPIFIPRRNILILHQLGYHFLSTFL